MNLKHRYRVEYFQFADEMFLSDMVYARECLRAYRKDVCLPFSIFSHVVDLEQISRPQGPSLALDLHNTLWRGPPRLPVR